jgi:hypothetical protein
MREDTDRDLQAHQDKVQRDAHKRAFARDGLFLGGFEFGSVGMHREGKPQRCLSRFYQAERLSAVAACTFLLSNHGVMRTQPILIATCVLPVSTAFGEAGTRIFNRYIRQIKTAHPEG